MTTHELARKLLEADDCPVFAYDYKGALELIENIEYEEAVNVTHRRLVPGRRYTVLPVFLDTFFDPSDLANYRKLEGVEIKSEALTKTCVLSV